MELLIILALLAVVSTLNIVCFFIGAKVGQKVVKGESVEIPTINSMQMYRERQERKEAEAKQSEIEKLMHNIEVYDGTGNGQQDV